MCKRFIEGNSCEVKGEKEQEEVGVSAEWDVGLTPEKEERG